MAQAGKQAATRNRKSSPRQSNNPQLAKMAKNSANQSNSNSQSNQSSESAESGESGESSESVEQLVQELEEAVGDLDKQLAKAEQQEREKGECDSKMLGECQKCQGKAGKCLGKLAHKLCKMGMKRNLRSKLSGLCKACSQCQSQCAGLCKSTSPKVGGKEAGWGSSDTRRNERDELVDNGQTTQLKGIKGAGPSLTAVEAAEDGSGVSTTRHVAKSRTFQRQVESFVEREDVPDDVKLGVKNYFEMIHQSELTSATAE